MRAAERRLERRTGTVEIDGVADPFQLAGDVERDRALPADRLVEGRLVEARSVEQETDHEPEAGDRERPPGRGRPSAAARWFPRGRSFLPFPAAPGRGRGRRGSGLAGGSGAHGSEAEV